MNLRLAFRSLWKSPAFALISISVLVLGIGANTAIFSVVNAVMLRPLPYQNPERIVSVGTLWPSTGRIGQVSLPDFLDWRAQSHSFETLSYYAAYPHSIFANNVAAQINCAIADTNFFNVFGVHPELGRLYSENDKKKSGTLVAVVSDSFYRRVFQGSPDIIGKTIKSGELELVIVGVMPPGFDFPERSEIWIPDYDFIVQPATQERSAHNFRAVGLLKPGVSLEQAQAEMKTIGTRLAQQYPKDDKLTSVGIISLRAQLVAQVRLTLYLLLSAVGVVLLIACANVANLMLAKVAVRRQEIAIRTALGASHGDIVRQLLTESLALAVVAGTLGLLLGYWSARALAHVTPALIANTEITLDWRVALFTLGVSLLCTIIFGLAPAFQASGGDLRSALHTGRTYSTAGSGTGRLRSGIMVAEIALSMALLVAAGILIRSLIALNAVDPGYRVDHLMVLHPMYPANSETDFQHAAVFYSALLEKASATPGIKEVAAATALPSQPTDSNGGFWIAGHPDPPPGDYITQSALFMTASPNYFHVVGIPIVKGRDFNEHDIPGAPLTCIVSEPLVRRFFPGENPIGQQIRFGYDNVTYKNYLTIVGVVAGVRQENLEEPPTAQIYVPYRQHPGRTSDMYLIFADSGGGAAALRTEAHRLNPEVPLELKSLTDVVGESFAPSRFRSGLLASFAGLALILALIGLYGVMSYTVEQRRSEIGVRMALGAQKASVVQLILGQGLWLVLPGVALGCVLAFVAGRVFASLVYGVSSSDPITFIGIAAILIAVSALAMYIPARRAARLDPMLALRSE